MPKRGDKHLHISVRVKRAIKRSKKTGVFSLIATPAEFYPVHISDPSGREISGGTTTFDVTFEYPGPFDSVAPK
jgi:hypothetical protein